MSNNWKAAPLYGTLRVSSPTSAAQGWTAWALSLQGLGGTSLGAAISPHLKILLQAAGSLDFLWRSTVQSGFFPSIS